MVPIASVFQNGGSAMWVSQTYLTNLRADGAAAAYFLFEAYRDDHAEFERRIKPKLADLAMSFGDAAHVFVPSENERSSIEREFNDWLHRAGLGEIRLPGILILRHAMADERSLGEEGIFISFADVLAGKQDAEAMLSEVKSALSKVSAEISSKPDIAERALQNLQLKPGIWGVSYDLKPLLINTVKRVRSWRARVT